MGIFARIFKNRTITEESDEQERTEFEALQYFMKGLLLCDHYVAKSEYAEKMLSYRKTVEYFGVLKNSGMLRDFCKKHGMSDTEAEQTLARFNSFEALIDAQNEQYVRLHIASEKDYLDNILKECDPNIKLDDDQRRAVITDEDYCLVVAGAGAGKTTTVAAKVKYLVEKQNIAPEDILVISFTNKAVNELKQRIRGELGIPCPIATFHSTGNAILHKQNPEKLNIVEPAKLYYVVRDYFRETILKNESAVNNLIMFFASYFDAPYEGSDLNGFFNNIAKTSFTTMRSELADFRQKIIDIRTGRDVTIQSEVMRSSQEVEIANFLYLNNIDYEYEPLYRYDIQLSRKPYTPDFCIHQGDKSAYIEHFGVTEDGRNNRYTQAQLDEYKKAVNDKVRLHRQHGTTLIYTFSSFNDRRSITEHLREQLEANGFTLTPRSNKEIMEKLIASEENRYIRKFVTLVCRFITNFKTNGYNEDEFNRMYHSTQNVRSRLFLNICSDCYLEYQRYLKENNAVDFQDMINESARILRETAEMKQKLNFKYVIVDEYQDISRQRFDLVSALHEVTDAKIIAVGDDWQSIYAFSGSDITLFTKFAEKMGYAKLLKIVRTYRNSQEIIDIAGNFIQKNETQIKKDLVSQKSIKDPVIIYTYNGARKKFGENNRSGANYALADAVEKALDQIAAYDKIERKNGNSSILLLGRYGFDGDMLEKSGLFEYVNRGGKIKSVKYPRFDITFMTAHSSKGLGYDNVIVINGRNETFGFPSKIEDDPVLSFVIKGDRSIDYAEERRLFYVAMTRTKNRVYFVAPEQNPSEFLLEIKHDYKNVSLVGSWNENTEDTFRFRKICPMCGYPMQLRYKKAYGLRLNICTNEPEVCSYMTNELKAGKLSIIKCDSCRDGYLVVKPARDGDYFLGCTNYKKDGTGCSRVMSRSYFYDYMKITDDEPAKPAVIQKAYAIPPKSQNPDTVNGGLQRPERPGSVEIERAAVRTVEYRTADLNEIVFTALRCLAEISGKNYYGVTMFVDVLMGSENERLKKAGFTGTEGYGALKSFGREEVYALVDWMKENRYVLQTKGRYPVLHPTYEGTHYSETITVGKLKKLAAAMNVSLSGEDGNSEDIFQKPVDSGF